MKNFQLYCFNKHAILFLLKKQEISLMSTIKENASLKSKSGGGYNFEHKVGAYFLSYLFANKCFDKLRGDITKIDFQMRGDGFQIDDLCITFNLQGENRRLFLSVKSNSQFTRNGAPKDFVNQVWIDFLGYESSNFVKGKDYLGLVCAPFGHENETAIKELLDFAASQDSQDLYSRLQTKRYTSARVRTFLSSFKCPLDIAEKYNITDNFIGNLLKSIIVFTCDFDNYPSNRENEGIENCRSVLSSGSNSEAENLWRDLIELAKEKNGTNGYIDLKVLLDKFRLKYKLKNYPTYEQDLKNLDNESKKNLDTILDMIGGKISIPRDKHIKEVLSTENSINLIRGISGSGKSVIAKKIAEQKRINQKVFFFDAGWFNDQTLSSLENDWRLSHSIAEIFVNISDGECWLIIDGLDRIVTDKGFDQLFLIIDSCNIANDTTPWRIIYTCQTEEWNNRIQYRFIKKGYNSTNWNITEIGVFNEDEINQIKKEYPSLNKVLNRPHLKSLLQLPKFLDVLVTYGTPDTTTWVGESDLIDWFWRSEVTSQKNGIAKSSFLLNIAEKQADTWQNAVPVSEISPSDLMLYDDLKGHNICTDNQNRIRFSHDLYGDWARQQSLISHISNVATFIGSRHESPLWHRAIRLFGLYLLEHYQDSTRYLNVFFSIQKEQSEFTTVHDLLLDSIIFSVNPKPILDKLWPEFKKDNGILLKRFFNRFLFVATIPNNQIMILGKYYGLSETEAALIDRFPLSQYWIPILQFIIQYKEDLEEIIPESIIDIAKIWLKHSRENYLYRVEIANIALNIAENIKINNPRNHYKNEEFARNAYSAAIYAYNENPERVKKLLLGLSGRGDVEPSEEIFEFIPDDEESRERVLPPWPDGPYTHVDVLFQKMCVKEYALTPIIIKDPELAKEILLGLIIEEPRKINLLYGDTDYSADGYGIIDLHDLQPALPGSGPFSFFLNSHPLEGLNLIIKLVNFATERYIERKIQLKKRYPESDLKKFADVDSINEVQILLSGLPKILKGDHQVYYWYRDSTVSSCPKIIVSMLMDLEKFLYEKIDKKESIDLYIQEIYAKSESVSMLGILSSVGKYDFSLFHGPLFNIFSVSEIYQWELLYNERSLSGIYGLFFDNKTREKLAKWHSMPHRKLSIYSLACILFINYSQLQHEFEQYRLKWEEKPSLMHKDSDEYVFLYGLIERFKRENYTTTVVNSQDVWVFNEPDELKQLLQKDDTKFNEAQNNFTSLSFLMECSKILEKGELLDDEKLEYIWNYIQTISIQNVLILNSTIPFQNEDIIAGGIAELMILGGEWLEKNPDNKQWCIDKIVNLVTNPPPSSSDFDSPMNPIYIGWDSFSAWTAPYIWAEDVKSIKKREIIFRLATAYHYKTVEILFSSCFKIRATIRDEFYQLVHFAIICSFSRIFGEMYYSDLSIQNTHTDYVDWLNQKNQNFIDGSLSFDIPPILHIIKEIGEFNPPNNRGGRKWNSLEFHDRNMLKSSLQWLNSVTSSLDANEQSIWEKLIKNINSFVIYSIKNKNNSLQGYHYPDDFDNWYFSVATKFITETTNIELSNEIWKSYFDLEKSDFAWTKNFLLYWIIQLPACSKNPASFIREWQKMIEYALSSENWKYSTNNYSLEENWCQLLGIQTISSDKWNGDLKEIVEYMKPYYEKWAIYNLSHFDCLKCFTGFLTMPASENIRLSALKWIEQYGYSVDSPKLWKDNKQNEKLAELLDICWKNDRQCLVAETDTFSTFKQLLKGLTNHQVPLAMELTENIRTKL